MSPSDARPPFDEWCGRWRADTPADPAELRRWQLARAWAVAEELSVANAYYRERLALPDDRTEAAFRSLPRTTKHDVVADCSAAPPYGSRSKSDRGRIREFVETSGSTGKGKEVYVLDEHDALVVRQAEAVGFWWAGVRPGTRVLLTLPVGVTAAGQWYLGGLKLIGAHVIHVGTYPTDQKVDILHRYGADVVVGTPTYVQRLAVACEEAGIDPASLGVRSLVVAGEAYTPVWAASIERRWGGALLYEQYGCTERVFAWSCPGGILRDGELGVLHFVPELSYWEVVDPESGEPVRNGSWGELISTPLHAWTSPLLRFATRDRVQLIGAGDCQCGRPVPGIRGGAVQRYDDMLKIRGVNVWPAALDRAVFSVAGVVDYRGRVAVDRTGRETVEVTVECDVGGGDVADAVRRKVHETVGLHTTVTIVGPGAISRSIPEGFVKIARWKDDRLTARQAGPEHADPGRDAEEKAEGNGDVMSQARGGTR